MRVNHKDFMMFDYISNKTKNPYQLGDVVIKEKEYLTDNIINEIGVVLQVHDDNELRTDMFGNEDISMLRLATDEEIKKYRPELIGKQIQPTYTVILRFDGIIADDPLSAAKQVAGDIKEDGADSWTYDVIEEYGNKEFTVDLTEEDEDAVLPNN
jgi:hypothetical protein